MRPDFKIKFRNHFNPLECSMLFPNDHIRGLTTAAIMVFLLWASRFYTVLIIQFPRFTGIFKRLFRSFYIKNVFFYHFLFIFQNFEVIISWNVVRYNCQTRMWRMTMSKQSANIGLIKHWRTFFEFKFSMWYVFKNKSRGSTHLNRIGCIWICFQQIWMNGLCFGLVSIVLILVKFFSQNICL